MTVKQGAALAALLLMLLTEWLLPTLFWLPLVMAVVAVVMLWHAPADEPDIDDGQLSVEDEYSVCKQRLGDVDQLAATVLNNATRVNAASGQRISFAEAALQQVEGMLGNMIRQTEAQTNNAQKIAEDLGQLKEDAMASQQGSAKNMELAKNISQQLQELARC